MSLAEQWLQSPLNLREWLEPRFNTDTALYTTICRQSTCTEAACSSNTAGEPAELTRLTKLPLSRTQYFTTNSVFWNLFDLKDIEVSEPEHPCRPAQFYLLVCYTGRSRLANGWMAYCPLWAARLMHQRARASVINAKFFV
jgi:hypothetical protein